MNEFLDEAELRALLKLDGASKLRTWSRVRPYFAPALLTLPTGSTRGHRLYVAVKVRELLAARQASLSPLARTRALRAS